jgi:hypothetical protein
VRHLVVGADIFFEKEANTQGRSQWSRGLRCGSEAARLLGLWARIPQGASMSVVSVCSQVEVSALGSSSRGALPSVVCLISVMMKAR